MNEIDIMNYIQLNQLRIHEDTDYKRALAKREPTR